jgi:tRNA(Leu) C34 or U34 (ribose-2'-O)-methylase TrmL
MHTLCITDGTWECDYVEMTYKMLPELKNCERGRVKSERFPCMKNVVYIGQEKHRGMYNTAELILLGKNIDDEKLTDAKKKGIRILCAERKNAISIYESNLTGPMILVFGGEMRGISAKIMKHSDQNIFLPYGSDFRNALSANSAAAVFAFEAYRQRNAK